MKTFETLTELFDATNKHQVTAQELINKQSYFNGEGWKTFEMSDELKREIVDKIVNVLGGQEKTKTNMRFTLMRETPQHWGLSRTVLEKHSGKITFHYIAGQDYTSELNEIRKKLK